MSNLENLIRTLLLKGITISGVQFNKDGNLCYAVDGFYKSGCAYVYQDGETIIANMRYGDSVIISESDASPFQELVALNYEWWDKSKERLDDWKTPDARWMPHLIEHGFVKEKVDTVKTYI